MLKTRLVDRVYLHYALDLWEDWWRKHQACGEIYIVRYADNFVVGFQYQSDAIRFHAEVRKRMGKFDLELQAAKQG